ncbi:MAG: DUF305 domain-containing protein [Parasphingorhabdus sp.]|uniref:DUF305 domain-containing protein n=1 Tax=Parasphingorhabdus sp. TaxID=2709688 RepID=UPI00329A775D
MKYSVIMLATGTMLVLSACNRVDDTMASAENLNMQNDGKEATIIAEDQAKPLKKGNSGGVDHSIIVALMQQMVDQDEGTFDIARQVVKYSKDSEATALAQRIIDGENKDIAAIEAWLGKQDFPPTPAQNSSKTLGSPEKVIDIPKVTTAEPEE